MVHGSVPLPKFILHQLPTARIIPEKKTSQESRPVHPHVRGNTHGSYSYLQPAYGRWRRPRRRGGAAGRGQASPRPHIPYRTRRCRRCGGHGASPGVHRRAIPAPQVAAGAAARGRPQEEAGEVAQGDARLAHGARGARRLGYLPGRPQPSRRLLAAGRRSGPRRRHAGPPVQVPKTVQRVLLLQRDGVRDVGGDHHPADERVLLPLGGEGGGAGDHRRARHGGAHGSIRCRLHPHGVLLHLHHRAHHRRLPLRHLHGAVPAQDLEPRRPRAVRARRGPGRRAVRATPHPRAGHDRPIQVRAAALVALVCLLFSRCAFSRSCLSTVGV